MLSERPTGSNGLATNLLVLNGFGVLAAFAVAAALFASAAGGGADGSAELALPQVSVGWVSGLVGFILGLGFMHTALYLKGRRLPGWERLSGFGAASVALLVGWPAALLGGYALSQAGGNLALALLPLCMLLAVGLPIWWLLAFARRGLRTPAHRTWGTASVVLMAGLPLVIVLEFSLILAAGVLLMAMMVNQPELLNSMNEIGRALSSGEVDLDRLMGLFESILRSPGVMFMLIAGLAVVVPLVEEAFKPLGLWFLGQRGVSPLQGFSLGAVSGATFALVESLTTLSAVSGEGWIGLVIGRMGTALLHITCSGLVGLGLGLAWSRARYAQLAGLFLLAVVLHGTWNGFAQFLGLMPIINAPAVEQTTLSQALSVAVLAALTVISALILAWANRRLRSAQAQEDAALAAVAAAAQVGSDAGAPSAGPTPLNLVEGYGLPPQAEQEGPIPPDNL